MAVHLRCKGISPYDHPANSEVVIYRIYAATPHMQYDASFSYFQLKFRFKVIFFFSDPQERVSLYETKIGYYLDELKGLNRYFKLKCMQYHINISPLTVCNVAWFLNHMLLSSCE